MTNPTTTTTTSTADAAAANNNNNNSRCASTDTATTSAGVTGDNNNNNNNNDDETASRGSSGGGLLAAASRSLFGSPMMSTASQQRRNRRRAAADASGRVVSDVVAAVCDSVRDLFGEFATAAREDRPLVNCASTERLCGVLEAVFLHGVRDTLLERVSSALTDGTRRPQPSFWPVVMLVTHSTVLDNISQMSQIRCDVGRCRAWLRLSLNDGLLTSYLQAIMNNGSGGGGVSLHLYYDRHALLRSHEHVDTVCRQLSGLEATHSFQLAVNSCLLNSWPPDPLLMAGVVTGAVAEPRQPAVATGIDVAAIIDEPSGRWTPLTDAERDGQQRRDRVLGRTPSLIMGTFDADGILDFISQRRNSTAAVPSSNGSAGGGSPLSCASASATPAAAAAALGAEYQPVEQEQSYISLLQSYRAGSPRARSLMQTPELGRCVMPPRAPASLTGSSSPLADAGQQPRSSDVSSSATAACGGGSDRPDSEAGASCSIKPADVQPPAVDNRAIDVQADADDLDDDGGEVLEDGGDPAEAAARRLLELHVSDVLRRCEPVAPVSPPPSPSGGGPALRPPPLHRLPHTLGLHAQHYRCAACRIHIGVIYDEPRVCAVDALYYCGGCHRGSGGGSFGLGSVARRAVVPSRVLHNWDFGEYAVSERSWRRLRRAMYTRVYNVFKLNATLYGVDAVLERARLLRTQVLFLYAFLRTCAAAASALDALRSTLTALHPDDNDDDVDGGGDDASDSGVNCDDDDDDDNNDASGEIFDRSGDEADDASAERRPSHLWRHVHRYTLADLLALRAGRLTPLLQRVVMDARAHVLTCVGCSQKGFICEVCRDAGVIYPFDLATTDSCRRCGVVLHRHCWRQVDAVCPRCERRRRRSRRQSVRQGTVEQDGRTGGGAAGSCSSKQ